MSPKVSDEHKETRRKQILEAAKRVFVKKGYERATMKDVVEESGMSRGGVYLYFSSTEDMMTALLEEEERENIEQLETFAASDGPVWDIIVQLIRDIEQNIVQMSSGYAAAIYEFYISRSRYEKYVPSLQRHYGRTVDVFVKLLQRGTDRGEFRPVIPLEHIARLMISLVEGMTLHCAHMGPERIDLHAQIEACIAMLQVVLQVPPESNARG